MAADAPTWRQVFDVWEELTASQLDRVMRTELFARVLSLGVTSTDVARRRLEDLTGRWLRVWNLPSRRDVHDLQDLLLALDRRLRDVDRRLDALDGPVGGER